MPRERLEKDGKKCFFVIFKKECFPLMCGTHIGEVSQSFQGGKYKKI